MYFYERKLATKEELQKQFRASFYFFLLSLVCMFIMMLANIVAVEIIFGVGATMHLMQVELAKQQYRTRFMGERKL